MADIVELVVGYKYKAKPDKLNIFSNDCLIDERTIFDCMKIDPNARSIGEFLYHDEQLMRIHKSYLLEANDMQTATKCSCNIWAAPCSCGAMANEMKLKGMVKCNHTQLWIEK